MSRSISALWLGVFSAIALLLGFWVFWRDPGGRAVSRESGLNVLLITIDTLRADAVGAYGQPGGITPWIDKLAAAGARFSNAHAHGVLTLPSHANILSGRLPSDHGIHDNAGFRFPSRLDTLARLLKSNGYRTGAFVSAFPLESRFGLTGGFDLYDDHFADAARPAFLIQERSGRETVARARQWLESSQRRPSFCWVHVYEPHFPYAPPEPFVSRFANDPYHAEVSAADAALGALLEPILAAGNDGRTLVVLTADHGEALGDHGEATHGVFGYEATLKVPLVIYQPRSFGPTVVDAPASHVDILPTILDAVALPEPAGLAGRSLLGAIADPEDRSTPSGHVTYFEALSASLTRRWAPLDGIIRNGMKYIELPIPELYDLRSDPGEEHNLASSQPARVGELRRLLDPFHRARAAVAHTETAETRERLRSLGYITVGGGAPPDRYTEADDPKRLIELDTRLQKIVGLYLAGNMQSALSRARALVEDRPQMPLSLFYLAQLERETGNLQDGIETLRKAVALVPENTEAVVLLGAYLTQAGRASEAVALLEPYSRRGEPDVEVLRTRAIALAKIGRAADALATLSRAREQDPSNAMLLLDTGTVQLMAGDRHEARRAFEAALAAAPNLARAHSSLGILDVEEKRVGEAVRHWTAATALDPRELETIFGLGLSLAHTGRTAEARAALGFFAANAPPARYERELDRARAILAALPR